MLNTRSHESLGALPAERPAGLGIPITPFQCPRPIVFLTSHAPAPMPTLIKEPCSCILVQLDPSTLLGEHGFGKAEQRLIG